MHSISARFGRTPSARFAVVAPKALAVTFLSAASAVCFAQAGAYPSKPVKLVVGFAAGGPTDVVARAFADHASRVLGQPFIIDNKPGANTILAAQAVASAPADGYTLLFGATNHTMIPGLYSGRVKFDAVKSFQPLWPPAPRCSWWGRACRRRRWPTPWPAPARSRAASPRAPRAWAVPGTSPPRCSRAPTA